MNTLYETIWDFIIIIHNIAHYNDEDKKSTFSIHTLHTHHFGRGFFKKEGHMIKQQKQLKSSIKTILEKRQFFFFRVVGI
jgi:hypothetical protein